METYDISIELTVAGVTVEHDAQVIGQYFDGHRGSRTIGGWLSPADEPETIELNCVQVIIADRTVDIQAWLSDEQKEAIVSELLEGEK